MNVLGLKIAGHDTGAALISDGRVIAIAEERLNRVKHSPQMFPEMAISYCLEAFKVKSQDVDLVVIDQVDSREEWPMADWFREHTGNSFSKARVHVINHHDAHAASSFFCSPFDQAAVLVYDGSGEKFVNHFGVSTVETETMYRGEGNRLFMIQKTTHLQEAKRFPYTYGIAKLYQRISEKYLDFGKYNEGKMMGLAPYGNDSVLKQLPARHWYTEHGGHIVCNAQFTYPERSAGARIGKVTDPAVLRSYAVTKIKNTARSVQKHLGAAYYRHIFKEPKLFPPTRLPRPARTGDVKLPDEYYASVAYLAQKMFEEVAVSWAKKLKEITGLENICVAGGAGLNIDANKKFIDDVGFKHVFVQPASSDTGIALGCALYGWHQILDKPRFWKMESAALGRPYSDEEIKKALEDRKDEVVVTRPENIAAEAARLMAEGNIFGWFQGGGEYGPRALGHRSILCDARSKDTKDILNNKVKHREPWRPFAAAVLREKMSEWFELEEESPFMLLAAQVHKDKQAKVPSIVHVDGTCRIQSVTSKANGRYYDLIKEFDKLTGVPLILNTSFNLGGDPIIETPADALECFLKTKMDYLVIEDRLIKKKVPDA